MTDTTKPKNNLPRNIFAITGCAFFLISLGMQYTLEYAISIALMTFTLTFLVALFALVIADLERFYGWPKISTLVINSMFFCVPSLLFDIPFPKK